MCLSLMMYNSAPRELSESVLVHPYMHLSVPPCSRSLGFVILSAPRGVLEAKPSGVGHGPRYVYFFTFTTIISVHFLCTSHSIPFLSQVTGLAANVVLRRSTSRCIPLLSAIMVCMDQIPFRFLLCNSSDTVQGIRHC